MNQPQSKLGQTCAYGIPHASKASKRPSWIWAFHPCEHSAYLGFLILQEIIKISCANLKIWKVLNLFSLPFSGWFIDQIVAYNIWICGTYQRHLLPVWNICNSRVQRQNNFQIFFRKLFNQFGKFWWVIVFQKLEWNWQTFLNQVIVANWYVILPGTGNLRSNPRQGKNLFHYYNLQIYNVLLDVFINL